MKYKVTVQITLDVILDGNGAPNPSTIEGLVKERLIPPTWAIYNIPRKEVEVVKIEEV